ncbi:MAG TPA: hypothetical protein VKG84_01055 [Candidatus Acidoferrales bacterium]|nr:hypothetical protein [Candidatus Acidoferrales bacterium]
MTPADSHSEHEQEGRGSISLPAPTAWPIVLASGFTLLFAGLVTSPAMSFLGAILTVVGCAGWFCEVLPHEKHHAVPVAAEEPMIAVATHRGVEHFPLAPELARAVLPLQTYPISAGIKGGLAGSVGMAVLAVMYGVLKQKSIWYPINLLAATVYGQSQNMQAGPEALYGFHLDGFLLACVIHLVTSLLVGLLYGAMLPMFPTRPILLGGVIAPVLWTGLLHSILGMLNPLLVDRIDWRWFIASQCAFGILAGLVVKRQHPTRTKQKIPFAVLAGIEAPGTMHEHERGQ